MEYQKTNVNAFLGLDNNQRPELIKNEEASDIENLRFEKLGYLTNRNGVDGESIYLEKNLVIGDIKGTFWSIGAVGMSEYVIEVPWGVGSGVQAWPPYDDASLGAFTSSISGSRFTDRFMIYALRLPARKASAPYTTDPNNNGPKLISGYADNTINRYTWKYKMAYILVPLTGPTNFKDRFAFAPNGNTLDSLTGYEPRDITLPTLFATIGSRTINRADDKPKALQIYAPSRWLGVHNQFSDNNSPKDLNWIEHYVSMQQYRDSMVISDMTNGDIRIVDEYSESEYNEIKRHRFSLRENALAMFDVDDVVIDFGIANWNNGVETSVALYKFYLPRNRFISTVDNYSGVFNGPSESPSYTKLFEKYDDTNLEFQVKWRGLSYSDTSSFMTFEWWTGTDANTIDSDDHQGSAFTIDIENKYLFTNQNSNDEYDDLFGTLTLTNPNIKEDDQVSSDIYIWDDFKVAYYPVSGTLQNQYCLTALDRTWNKTNSAGTKLIKLKTRKGVEQRVPLGVWRYRFVWYMGNGEYSAPSAELVVPDLLFSGLKDDEIIESVGQYTRPFGIINSSDSLKTNIDVTAQSVRFINENANSRGIRIFKEGVNPTQLDLTEYGKNFLKVKEQILSADHKYGAYYSSTNGASWPTNWSTENILAQGNLCVSCTLYPGNNIIECTGTIAESGFSVYGDVEVDDKKPEIKSYNSSELHLSIPMFPSTNNSVTYNSLFTDYGVIRLAYQNLPSNAGYDSRFPSYSIVMSGTYIFGHGIANDTDRYGYEENGTVNEDLPYKASNPAADGSGEIFINIHSPNAPYDPTSAPSVALDLDRNNEDDDSYYPTNTTIKRWNWRNMTQVRGAKNHSDRIINLKSGIPAEVISRIYVSGYGGLKLCDYGDAGTVAFQRAYAAEYTLLNSGNRTSDYLHRYINLSTDTLPAVIGVSRKFFNVTEMSYHGNIWFTGYWTAPQTQEYYFSYKKSGLYDPKIGFSNLKIMAYLPGERLTISEQLSMYVPASLLFEAPHIKIVVPSNRIPRRARQLLIFRTRASHDNAWQPHEYGLVKAVDVIRDGATGLPTGTHSSKIEFLDDVKSSELDYSYSVPDYDGFTNPIKSRFCIPLNERVFYANIKEAYKPHSPRNSVKINTTDMSDGTVLPHENIDYGTNPELARLWSYRLATNTVTDSATTNIQYNNLYYFVAYNDQARSYSLSSCSGLIQRSANNQKPIFYCLPSAYDPAIEQINIYRLSVPSALTQVVWSGRISTNTATVGNVYYVIQGVVEYNGIVYYPNSVIQAFHGGDVGYDGTRMNYFYNYFDTTVPAKDRGHAKSYCQPIIIDITNRYDEGTGPQWIEKIGTLTPEDEGIFYDNDLPAIGRLPLKQFFQNEDVMASGLRWSEPYQPNKLKLPSLMEIRAGDGDQITGLATLYGNLIVLKERSIHRLAVQGSQVPVSRVDEISNNVGCIAPNTIITVNNTLYFLSWAGFYKYDNNQLSKIDGKFSEELQIRLRSSQNGVINPALRDASCGWNPTYRELYLTIPVMSTYINEGDYEANNSMGIALTDNKGTREVRGITYAINIDTGLVTKFRYMDDAVYFTDPITWPEQFYPPVTTQRAPRVYARLYYANTLGQMRSAEVLPPRTNNYLLPAVPSASDASMEFMRMSMFIESPTKINDNLDKPNDDYLIFALVPTNDPLNPTVIQTVNTTKFVRVFWASKSWTLEDKSVLKRVRKVFSYIAASDDPVILRGITHTSPEGETATSDTTWKYTYIDSRISSPRYGYSVTGEIMGVPTESAGQTTSPSQNRGERYTFNIEGSGAFQMEYFGFYWKPINQYER